MFKSELWAAWMGAGFGGKWTRVYVWLSPFAAHLTYHNIVNRLYPSTKLKVKKKKDRALEAGSLDHIPAELLTGHVPVKWLSWAGFLT